MSTENTGLRPCKTLSRHTILEHGRFLTVESHTVEWPSGQVITDWPWIIVPDAAIVVAVTTDGKFLCFRQTKYAVDGTSLAPVGGMIESGEDPLDAAKRELLEETGYEASDWTNLGSYSADPNRGMGIRHLFLARHAERVAEPDSDDVEDQLLLCLDQSELEEALAEGEFKVVSWAAAVALALNHMHLESRKH